MTGRRRHGARFWDEIEAGVERERQQVEAQARDRKRAGDTAAAAAELGAFSQRVTDTALQKLEELLRTL